MLIACQKFRSCMLGQYNRSCHVITRNMHEMWGLIYLHAMRTVPSHATCYHMCSDVMRASCGSCTQASQLPYVYVARQKLFMDMPCTPAERYLTKLTASHFSTLNMKIANWNMLKRILITMHNENTANCIENFRICTEEPVAPLYKW